MGRAELGTKRACPSCAGRFYDLNKVPAQCPMCGHTVNPNESLRGRRAKTAAEPPAGKPPGETANDKTKTDEGVVAEVELTEDFEGDVDDLPEDDGDADDDVLEDASDLGADDDDVAEVVVKTEPAKEDG